MKIIFGSRLFDRKPFKNEDELETVVKSRPELILGEDVMYISQKPIETAGGAGSIPEAIAVDLSNERWYLIEVEFAVHDFWRHVEPHISKQMVVATHEETKFKVRDIVLERIKKEEKWRKILTHKGIADIDMPAVIKRILDKDPTIVIPIDEPPSVDAQRWTKILKWNLFFPVVEKYKEDESGDVAYNLRVDEPVTSPESPDEKGATGRPNITPEEFLRQCASPGRQLFDGLRELANRCLVARAISNLTTSRLGRAGVGSESVLFEGHRRT